MSLAHAARGKVLRSDAATVVFQPLHTTYELHVQPAGGVIDAAVGTPVDAVIRGNARKVYTVPSGGLFVSPIMGPPRILQGRVKDASDGELTINCGVIVNVRLPREAGAVELAQGAIEVGSLVNVVLMPGTTLEVVTAPVTAA